MEEIQVVVLNSLVSSSIILLMGKWGVTEKMQQEAPDLISKMFSCPFCLGFWISLFLSVVFVIFTNELLYIATPVAAAPLIRKLL